MRKQEHSVFTIRRIIGTTRGVATAFVVVACVTMCAAAVVANGDLSAMISAAREKFTPIGDDQVAAVRAELDARAAELERFVRPQSANGRRWLDYLRWDAFKMQLAAEGQPEFEPLAATYQQLNRDENGLELEPFRRLSDALRRYIDVSVIARQENQADT